MVREGDKGLLGRRWRRMATRSDFQNTHTQKEKKEKKRIERGKEKESKGASVAFVGRGEEGEG